MKLSKQQLKTSTRHYIKKCAGAVCTSKLHESARNSSLSGRLIQGHLIAKLVNGNEKLSPIQNFLWAMHLYFALLSTRT